MTDARAALFPRDVGMQTDAVTSDCAGLSTHRDWLQELRKGDFVLVRNGPHHYRTPLTDATPCFLHVGKLKFRRDSGWIIISQQRFGTKLILVRNEQEFT